MISEAENQKLFSRIAQRYDLLNHLLSFGLDKSWREKLVKLAVSFQSEKILDLATGTGDVALELAKKLPSAQITGIDITEPMLKIARQKAQKLNLAEKITFQTADLLKLPFPDQSFDLATIAFALRNIAEPEKALREIKRVLKPGGRILILELTLPQNPLTRFFYLFYLKGLLALMGGWVSGNFAAYKYLGASIVYFSKKQPLKMMETQGFENLKITPLTWGTVSIYSGEKFK